MDQPLGYAIGNTLEVQEAIATLQGKGPQDLQDLCIVLGGQMLQLAHVVDSAEAGERRMQEVLDSGAALAKFKQMIAWQQGDAAIVDDPNKLPQASISRRVLAPTNGYVGRIEAEQAGLAAMIMGAGRATKDDIIDYGAGIILRKKVGDAVKQGECIAELYTDREESLQQAEQMVLEAYEWTEERPAASKLIYGIVTSAEEKRF